MVVAVYKVLWDVLLQYMDWQDDMRDSETVQQRSGRKINCLLVKNYLNDLIVVLSDER